VFRAVRDGLSRRLQALREVPREVLLERRYAKYRRMGRVVEALAAGGDGDRSEARP
jgi:acetyl-CoA carboxylase alpha subunit